jgi:hypothetical protein
MLRMPALGVILVTLASSSAGAQSNSASELAEQLSNPVASLVSIPFQFNTDSRIGPARDGERVQLNFQPVIPVSLNSDWSLISRTIVPLISQRSIFPGAGDQGGVGDVTQSFFLSPKAPGPGGLIWGVGPVFLLPTGTDPLLGTEKWGAGPTAVLLTQQSGWTIGILANHIWSYAGESSRTDVSSTFLQPFISYTTKDAWTYTLNSESTYDWIAEQWSVPVNFNVSKLLQLGEHHVSVGAGVRYWAESPITGAHDWGARATLTILLPQK